MSRTLVVGNCAPSGAAFGGQRKAFTLVELLVAMTISLIMVYAMVEVFRTIGSSTSDGRAVIDMQGQLKTAKALLHNDLRGLTVAGTTWQPAETANGYFYYDEGQMATRPGGTAVFANDVVPVYRTFTPGVGGVEADRVLTSLPIVDDDDPNIETDNTGRGSWDYMSVQQANNPHNLEVSNLDTSTTPLPRNSDQNFAKVPHWRHAFGDVNDVLMFTVRSTTVPFRGRYNGTMVESQLAEVIWWTQLNENPSTRNGVWDLGESFSLRRRVLLIRPDLNVALSGNANTGVLPMWGTPAAPLPSPIQGDPMFAKIMFLHDNDISVRVAGLQTTTAGVPGAQPLTARPIPVPTGSVHYLAANSLSDLAQRHNRTFFDPYPITVANGVSGISPVLFHMDDDTLELAGFEPAGDIAGEDVVIRKVAAFDVRAFDPYAPIFEGNYGGNIVRVQPGDEAFAKVATDLMPATGPVGYGAFVDLGWGQTIRHDPARDDLVQAGLNPAAPWPTGKTLLEIRSQTDLTPPLPPPLTTTLPTDPLLYTSYFMRPSVGQLPADLTGQTRIGRTQVQAIIGAPETPIVMLFGTTGTAVYSTNSYDTWSLAYESDGINQNLINGVDEGRDGFARDGGTTWGYLQDSATERETSPPYDRQLRGIEVRIRMYDLDTRQIRQTTVIGDLSDLH